MSKAPIQTKSVGQCDREQSVTPAITRALEICFDVSEIYPVPIKRGIIVATNSRLKKANGPGAILDDRELSFESRHSCRPCRRPGAPKPEAAAYGRRNRTIFIPQ